MGSVAEKLPTNASPRAALLEPEGIGLRSITVIQEEASAVFRRPIAPSILSPALPIGATPPGLPVVRPGVIEPPRATRTRDRSRGLPPAEVTELAVVPPAPMPVTAPEFPTRLTDTSSSATPVGLDGGRVTEIIVAFNTKVGIAFSGPSPRARTTAKPRTGATATPGDGAAATASVAAATASLVPERAPSLLPSVTGREIVRAPVPVQVKPGLRTVPPRSVTPGGAPPPASDTRASRGGAAKEEPTAR